MSTEASCLKNGLVTSFQLWQWMVAFKSLCWCRSHEWNVSSDMSSFLVLPWREVCCVILLVLVVTEKISLQWFLLNTGVGAFWVLGQAGQGVWGTPSTWCMEVAGGNPAGDGYKGKREGRKSLMRDSSIKRGGNWVAAGWRGLLWAVRGCQGRVS